jgi:hypothetical protein
MDKIPGQVVRKKAIRQNGSLYVILSNQGRIAHDGYAMRVGQVRLLPSGMDGHDISAFSGR